MPNYLGYGSPEALEEAIKAGEGEEFIVYAEGLIFASVCSSLPYEEVVAKMRGRPCGTTGGWFYDDHESFSSGEPNPCPCDQKPDTHKHYLFSC